MTFERPTEVLPSRVVQREATSAQATSSNSNAVGHGKIDHKLTTGLGSEACLGKRRAPRWVGGVAMGAWSCNLGTRHGCSLDLVVADVMYRKRYMSQVWLCHNPTHRESLSSGQIWG